MWWLLVGCAGVDGNGGESTAELDVDVSPRLVAATFGPDALDLDTTSVSLVIGSVRVENYEPETLVVETHATSSRDDLDETGNPWLDVTFLESAGSYYEIEGGGNHWRLDLDVWAYGVDLDGLARGEHSFDLEVLIAGHSYPVEAVITLE